MNDLIIQDEETSFVPDVLNAYGMHDLPPHWNTVRLRDVLKEVDTRAKELGTNNERASVLSLTKNYGLILQTDRFDKRIATEDVSKYKVVKNSQIVYNPYVIWEGAIYALRKKDYGLVSPVYLVWQSVGADSSFLDYLLRTPQLLNTYLRISSGAVKRRRSVKKGLFLDIKVPLPPLSEQRAIAHALQTIQEAKETRQRELTLERERKAAMMQHLFAYGTRNEPRKQTEIGEIPESWSTVHLDSVFETQLGKMLSQKVKSGRSPKPYLRNANIQWGRVDCNEVYEMDFEQRELEKFRLRNGDILVCEGGEIGRTAIWRAELPECYFQKAVHRLRPKYHDMLAGFFLYWMEKAFRFSNVYGVAGTQTTIAHLPQEKLKAMKIPKPVLHLKFCKVKNRQGLL